MYVLGTYPTRLHHHNLSTVTLWSRVTQCLDPSTIWLYGQESWRFLFLRQQGVVLSTYHTYQYTSDTSTFFCLTKNRCIRTIYFQTFNKIFSQSKDCPVDVFICLQYTTHLSYIDMSGHSDFGTFNIHAPPSPHTLYFGWYFIILVSFSTDENFSALFLTLLD